MGNVLKPVDLLSVLGGVEDGVTDVRGTPLSSHIYSLDLPQNSRRLGPLQITRLRPTRSFRIQLHPLPPYSRWITGHCLAAGKEGDVGPVVRYLILPCSGNKSFTSEVHRNARGEPVTIRIHPVPASGMICGPLSFDTCDSMYVIVVICYALYVSIVLRWFYRYLFLGWLWKHIRVLRSSLEEECLFTSCIPFAPPARP